MRSPKQNCQLLWLKKNLVNSCADTNASTQSSSWMLITLTFGGNKRSNYFALVRKLNDVLMKLTYFLVYGLKCYECVSTKGWDDCAEIKTEKECPSFADRCGKYKVEGTSGQMSAAVFAKGCATKIQCDKDDKSELCKLSGPKGNVNCKVDCCQGNLCNGAKVLTVSGVLLLACTLLTFSRWICKPFRWSSDKRVSVTFYNLWAV